MSIEQQTDFNLYIRSQYSNPSGSSIPKIDHIIQVIDQLLTGDGDNQSNLLIYQEIDLAVSGQQTISYTGLTDAIGRTGLTITRIRAAIFQVEDNSSHVGVRFEFSSGMPPKFWFDDLNGTGGFTIRPGGTVIFLAPDAKGYVPGSIIMRVRNLSTLVPQTVNVTLIGS